VIAVCVLLAVLWHWSPPTTGTPAVAYNVRCRSAWGDTLYTGSVSDTTFTADESRGWAAMVPYRVDVQGCDAQGRCGPWSPVSVLWIQARWYDLFFDMGARTSKMPLTMVVGGAQALVAAWPDSEGK
jgi:hypothetical protein